MSYDMWDSGGVADPRTAKRARVDEGPAFAAPPPAFGGAFGGFPPPAQFAAPPQDDITASIMSALQGHLAPGGSEPSLGSALLDSLKSLAASDPQAAGLLNSVQPPEPMLALPPVTGGAPAAAWPEGVPMMSPPLPREEDSDDETPHRLPPGFGAIPEDIVEERARAREEARMLQIKATQECRFGKKCKKRDCPNKHSEGRDIDTAWNPCAFARKCKRKGCFYDHPEGRDIDNDPTKGMCKHMERCTRPDCLYDHPPGRAPVVGSEVRVCFFCHDPGHIAQECPRNPESWAYRHSQALPSAPMNALTNG